MSNALAYRRDIDGLRALAILPVVLYHAGFPGFSGGYVGVDLFFVISGYLISSIIFRELAAGEFSFAQFWLRRARRILPAMVLLVTTTLLIGFWLLAPSDLIDLGRSIRYQAYFVANHYFYGSTDYFDSAAELKPLLHMWSLAVEEQFYLLFPLLSVLFWRFLPRATVGWLWLAFALVSLGLSQWWMSHGQATAAFYLLPARAWELLAGTLLAWWHSRRPQFLLPQPLAELGSVLGLLLVLIPVVLYQHETPFPGLTALPAVLGAVLLIAANRQPTGLARCFSHPLLVGIGLISYSLYLWHWPLLVFMHYRFPEANGLLERGLVVVLSVLAAYLSWRWIEGPFRRRRWLSIDRRVWQAAALSIVVVFLVGRAVGKSDGYPERLPEEAQRYVLDRERSEQQKHCSRREFSGLEDLCRVPGRRGEAFTPQILVWGDSHSGHLLPALETLAEQNQVDLLFLYHPGCLPLLDPGQEPTTTCARFNERMFSLIAESGVSQVLLAARWSFYLYGEEGGEADPALLVSTQRFAERLQATQQSIRDQGVQLWLFQQVPLQNHDVALRLIQLAMRGGEISVQDRPLVEHRQRQREIVQAFHGLPEEVRLLDASTLLCADGRSCMTLRDGHALYQDDDHLSVFGSRYIAASLQPLFETALRLSQGPAQAEAVGPSS